MVNLFATMAMLCNNLRKIMKQPPSQNWEMAILCDWLILKTLSALVQQVLNTSQIVGITI